MGRFTEQQSQIKSIFLFLEETAAQHSQHLVSDEPIKSVKPTAVETKKNTERPSISALKRSRGDKESAL